MKKLWFKAKNYGWGWRPVTWQGWVIVGVYSFIIAFIFARTAKDSYFASDIIFGVSLPFIIITSLLFYICYKTGEKPSWRWGNKKDK